MNKNIIVYQAKSGAIEFKGDIEKDTIWATQAQISNLFGIDRTVVTKHITRIIKDAEVNIKSNVQNMHIANSDKPVKFYSLDIILAVGYRTNSRTAIEFRKWATKTLKEHLIKGYTINRNRISKNYELFVKSVDDVKKLLPKNNSIAPSETLELIKFFASTWFSLDAYDKEAVFKRHLTKKQVQVTAEEIVGEISKLKENLVSKMEATEIFAQERSTGNVAGIIGNVFQSLSGRDVYATIEEKAAHLLYFIIKNHPFVDGNKRSGAFAFVWFLSKAKIFSKEKFTPEVLTVLAILVAESNPNDKDKVINLVLNLLR